MALAAYEAMDLANEEKLKYLEEAAHTISNARPTTANRMAKVTTGSIEAAKDAMAKEEDVVEAIFEDAIQSLNRRYSAMDKVAKHK